MSKSCALCSAVVKFFSNDKRSGSVSKDTNSGYEPTASSSEPKAKEKHQLITNLDDYYKLVNDLNLILDKIDKFQFEFKEDISLFLPNKGLYSEKSIQV